MLSQLPIDTFPAWAHLNDIRFSHVKLQDVGDGKGLGLVAEEDLHCAESDGASEHVVKIPHDLVLSAEAVDDFAKVDQNFKQLLDAVGRQSTRHRIMLYLVSHLAQASHPKGGLSPTPWTEYTRLLPRAVPVPTMWTEPERLLLIGTSLEAALEAKLLSLSDEFDALRDVSEHLPFWNDFLWSREGVCLQDWALVDAWYRSRCLELPRSGTAMVPAIDMVNHSTTATAYYEEDDNGNVVLLIRPRCQVRSGEEVTISYGDAKPASETLFSYGFIDPKNIVHKLTLRLDPFPDDPLAKAKLRIFSAVPTLTISRKDGQVALEASSVAWHSPFVYLMCLNEEDGLSFRLLQDTAGDRQLRLLWQGEDVTDQAGDFETLIRGHHLCPVFQLRAITVLHEKVGEQWKRITHGPSDHQPEPLEAAGLQRAERMAAARILKDVESELLANALEALNDEMTNLLADDHVVAYLGSKEDFPIEQEEQATTATNDDADDFS
ncbi:SET domain protein [Metarhizium album ARSEF 1941]|uniref:SET domain protein n=1 Tax=Metarhizium album (strain ARSEF 1941) TaxID=1081103 RepID=A0A0B2WNL4_METAS|nr:SET domain protein [Metarhizium album ARSEF 1941]KHN95082.1 SET domain protein [Metarhizium album ARSEF 1941]